MPPIGGHTTKLSPDATQTAIDSVAYEVYDQAGQPAELEPSDQTFFKQERFTSNAHIWDEYSGIPNTEEHQEQDIVKTVDVFIGNQKTQKVKFFKNDYPISVEAFKTDKGFIRDRIGKDVAEAVKRRQKYVAIIDCYGDAFNGTNFTTPDGNSLANNSHTTLRGDTVDNLETGSMTPDNADILARSLESQLGQHGDWGGNILGGVFVPRNIYKTTKEVFNSEKLANSAENNLNLFETDYGTIAIKQSPLLGSTFNAGSNANTGYHFVAQNHHIVRRVLVDMELDMIEPKYTATDSWVERVRHAEVSYPETHFGYAASTGAV
ncbi:MAG: hypothetical protein AAB456_04195 [Patescibacteria group bacterium]